MGRCSLSRETLRPAANGNYDFGGDPQHLNNVSALSVFDCLKLKDALRRLFRKISARNACLRKREPVVYAG